MDRSFALVLLLVLCCVTAVTAQKNVCRSLKDYANLQNNPNCWHDPDVNADPEELAKRYGYPFETHEVITPDGYVLQVFRIPHNGSEDRIKKRKPAILQHGIAVDAGAWLARGKESPAFIFANHGFDVWLPNSRGSKYSQRHTKYTKRDPAFWDFTFHEMGLFDTPAIVNHVANVTGQAGQIVYVGHSMGSTISYVYASLRSRHARENLKVIISLAPIAFMSNVRSIVRLAAPFADIIQRMAASLGIYGLSSDSMSLLGDLCERPPFIILCQIGAFFIQGLNADEIQPDRISVYFAGYPSGMSLKTLHHYGQLLLTRDRFQQYDYGPGKNLALYNSSAPPEYDLSRIKVPVHLFYGRRDLLSDERDVFELFRRLHTEKTLNSVFRNARYQLSHMDFLAGRHSKALFDILVELAKGNKILR